MTPYKKVYGLTGGIATGKSTLANMLRQRNIRVVDMDQISREIFYQARPAYKQVLKEFGPGILDEDKNINRKKLGQIVFKDPARLDALNKISHPHIMDQAKGEVEEILQDQDLVFVDIPLLFETRDSLRTYGLEFYKTILVYLDRQSQLERLVLRDKISRDQAQRIIASQMDIELKRQLADIIIENLGTRQDLELRLEEFLSSI